MYGTKASIDAIKELCSKILESDYFGYNEWLQGCHFGEMSIAEKILNILEESHVGASGET